MLLYTSSAGKEYLPDSKPCPSLVLSNHNTH